MNRERECLLLEGGWNGQCYNDGDTTGLSVVYKEGIKTIVVKDSIYKSK